ncbi:MAG: H-NS family nucleoid-associated regulatory protein [Paraburkholderia terricola]
MLKRWSVMETYRRYIEKKLSLEEQIAIERRAAAHAVLIEVRACVQEFGFTSAQIFAFDANSTVRGKRPARYFDPQTGATWSGVGREPLWIRGKDRERFRLAPAHAHAGNTVDDDELATDQQTA